MRGRSRFGIVGGVVEVVDREELEPNLGLGLGTINKLVGCSKLAAEVARNLIEHHGGVPDGIEPEFTAYLLFGDVSTGHGNDGPPCAFCQAV